MEGLLWLHRTQLRDCQPDLRKDQEANLHSTNTYDINADPDNYHELHNKLPGVHTLRKSLLYLCLL